MESPGQLRCGLFFGRRWTICRVEMRRTAWGICSGQTWVLDCVHPHTQTLTVPRIWAGRDMTNHCVAVFGVGHELGDATDDSIITFGPLDEQPENETSSWPTTSRISHAAWPPTGYSRFEDEDLSRIGTSLWHVLTFRFLCIVVTRRPRVLPSSSKRSTSGALGGSTTTEECLTTLILVKMAVHDMKWGLRRHGMWLKSRTGF